MLGALQNELFLGLAILALKADSNLLGGLSLFPSYEYNTRESRSDSQYTHAIHCVSAYLLVEDRLGLTTVTLLLGVVTPLSLFHADFPPKANARHSPQ